MVSLKPMHFDQLNPFSEILHSPGCDLWLSIHGLRQSASGVSSGDEHSPVPMPLPEKIQFRGEAPIQAGWKTISVREESLSPAREARFRRRRVAQSSGVGPAVLICRGPDPSTAATRDVESFRRIHVQPYNGNFLKALFEIGENLRTLVIDILAMDDSENELIDAASFADRYTYIIKDFEVLRKTNISPLLEIQEKTKQVSEVKQLVMEQWVLRTAQLLFEPRWSWSIQPSVRQAIVPIKDWLRIHPDFPGGFVSVVLQQSNINGKRSPEQVRMFNHYHDLINPRSSARDSPIRALQRIYDPGLFVSQNGPIEVVPDSFPAHHWDPRDWKYWG